MNEETHTRDGYNKGLETAITLANEILEGEDLDTMVCALKSSMQKAEITAWWMFDNHTFRKIDITDPDWVEAVAKLWYLDRSGCFFVRNGEREVFSCPGHGRGETEKQFLNRLAAFKSPT